MIEEKDKIKSFRKDGNIVIEIPEETFIFAVENNPDAPVKVTDKDEFLNYIAEMLVEEIGYNHDSGLSSFQRLLDEAAEDAVESDKGVEFT
ncbi:MAG: hypothetical protein M3209_09530 [Acidobacteriota bacterium]|nr:hypothetical protein [Acidobacteriota bacterium]